MKFFKDIKINISYRHVNLNLSSFEKLTFSHARRKCADLKEFHAISGLIVWEKVVKSTPFFLSIDISVSVSTPSLIHTATFLSSTRCSIYPALVIMNSTIKNLTPHSAGNLSAAEVYPLQCLVRNFTHYVVLIEK